MSKSKSKDYLRKKSVNYKHSSRKRQRNRADVQFAPVDCTCRACRRSKSVAGIIRHKPKQFKVRKIM